MSETQTVSLVPRKLDMTAATGTLEERLAAALNSIGSSDLDSMLWSPFKQPPEYVGDPDLNVQEQEDFPRQSLARAILAAAKEHGLVVTASEETVIGEGELDAAWKEAEAALPGKGWWVLAIEHNSVAEPPSYRASQSGTLHRYADWADTPAAALRALAERLRR